MSAYPVYISGDSVVSTKLKFVWYGVPKAATRTLLRVFTVSHKEEFGGVKFSEIDGYRKRHFSGFQDFDINPYFKFTFVRNPYTRVASFWYEKFLNYDGSIAKQRMFSKHNGLEHTMPFQTFVEWLDGPDGADETADPHWLSQKNFITDPNGHVLTNFVGKLENFVDDVAQLWTLRNFPMVEFVQLNANQDRINKSATDAPAKNKDDVYKDLYNDKTLDIIKHRYKGDFDFLKYSDVYLKS